MGLQIIRVLRQGIWASLTGGWYFEPEQHILSNTLQMYFWLFLVMFPFSIFIVSSEDKYVLMSCLYTFFIGSVFAILITLVNFSHRLFNDAEVVETEKVNENAKPTQLFSVTAEDFGPNVHHEDSLYNPENFEFPSYEVCNQEGIKTSSDAVFAGEVGETNSDSKPSRDVAEINKDSSQNIHIKNDLEFTEWKDPVWQQPHSSRISPVPLGGNLRSKRVPDGGGLRAESFQTRSSFHIPDDLRSEDSSKKVYSANDMKVQSTGDMKDIIREGKSLLSSDSESFEGERNRTDTSESLIGQGASRICEPKNEFPKIMSEPQLVDDQTPVQPLKPKRVRLLVDDQIIPENEGFALLNEKEHSFAIRRSTSLVNQNQRHEPSEHSNFHNSVLPSSSFEFNQQHVIEEVDEEHESSPSLHVQRQNAEVANDDSPLKDFSFASYPSLGSISSMEEKAEKSASIQINTNEQNSRKSNSPYVCIPETLVNSLPEKARLVLDDDNMQIFSDQPSSSDANSGTKRPRALNSSKILNLLSDVNSSVLNDHNDTTPGSVHYYEDEAGNWVMYQFAEKAEPASTLTDEATKDRISSDPISVAIPADVPCTSYEPTSSSGIRFRGGLSLQQLPGIVEYESVQSVCSDNSESECTTSHRLPSSRRGNTSSTRVTADTSFNDIDTVDLWGFLEDSVSDAARRQRAELELMGVVRRGLHRRVTAVNSTKANSASNEKPKYRLFFNTSKSLSVLVNFDRQQLSTLIDVHQTVFENILIVVLSMIVSFLGFSLLFRDIYHDLLLFVVCVVIASSQYSLIKSVQPDSASPMHGYNRIIVFSRALYFCCFAAALIIIDSKLPCQASTSPEFTLYSIGFNQCTTLETAHFILTWIIPLLPVIFLLGLLPQCTTLLLFCLEQVDVHLFGGTAKASLVGSVVSTVVSLIVTVVMTPLAVWAVGHASNDNHFLFSFYCSLLGPVCYLLSRMPSEPSFFIDFFKRSFCRNKSVNSNDDEELPKCLKNIFQHRIENCVFVCPILLVVFFSLHISKLFSKPIMDDAVLIALYCIAGIASLNSNYLLPHLRKRLPWLCFDKPCVPLKAELVHNSEYCLQQAKVLIHEYIHIWGQIIEKYLLNTAIIVALTTSGLPVLADKYSPWFGCAIGTVFALKLMRYNFCNCSTMYLVLLLGVILFGHDWKRYSELPLMDFYVATLVIPKMTQVFKKLQFVFTYVAPWQIPWGSTFHAFAQPVSIPHSALLFTQAFISSLLGAPLSPFMGSAMFIMSYPRPIKFWEKDYKTKRQDVTSRRLALHLDPSPVGDDDDNLNSIYYEHLARSLQIYLAGDIALGRWGTVEQGDFFLMASESLNCLVHVTEVGNGFITFQVRGLEFRGTYCHQREVDAINEDPRVNRGLCCCSMKKIPGLLSLNEAFSQRWLAWEVITNSYIIDGYNITQLNSAQHNFATYEQKSTHSKLYVQSVIFLLLRCKKLQTWLKNETILEALTDNGYSLNNSQPVLDPAFDSKHHHDYDREVNGISREKFCSIYLSWIQHCAQQQETIEDAISDESDLVSLCFALAIYARRALLDACNNHYEFYLFGIHSLFKGAFSPTSAKDQWLLTDLDLVDLVVKPSIRMSIRLHLDNFISPDFLSPLERLYSIIDEYERVAVFAHESDPKWRQAILNNTDKLLTLRHVVNESCRSYRIITLDKKFLRFKIVKLNQECVRGLWAGQQHELIFLRNSNSERGSIQNARQALRNIINSSCDQPIGYPIYVSPLITSFIDSNKSVPSIISKSLQFSPITTAIRNSWNSFVERCLDGCTSGRYTSAGCVHSGANDDNISSPAAAANTDGSSLLSAGKPTNKCSVSTTSAIKQIPSSTRSQQSNNPEDPVSVTVTIGLGVNETAL